MALGQVSPFLPIQSRAFAPSGTEPFPFEESSAIAMRRHENRGASGYVDENKPSASKNRGTRIYIKPAARVRKIPTEGPRMCMKTKDEKSDILEGPTMLMKTKGLTNHSCQCLRGTRRSSNSDPPPPLCPSHARAGRGKGVKAGSRQNRMPDPRRLSADYQEIFLDLATVLS